MTIRGVCTSNRAGASSNASSVRLTFPAGTVAGDRIVCGTATNSGAATATAAAGANTWTATSGPDNPGAVLQGYLFARVLDSVDVAAGSVLFTWSGTGRSVAEGIIVAVGDNTTPFGTLDAQAAASDTWNPGPVAHVNNAEIVAISFARVASGTSPTVSALQPHDIRGDWTIDAQVATNYASGVNITSTADHLTLASGSVASGTQYGFTSTFSTSPAASHYLSYAISVGPPAATGFTGTATLSGSGTLTASGVPTFAGSATLTGSGTLAATGTPAPKGTAALTGSGTLTVTGTPAATGTAPLTGSGTLTTTATITAFTGDADLGGTGTLATTARITASGTAGFSSSGTLTAVGLPAFAGSAAFTGSGTLAAAGKLQAVGVAMLTGSGTLTTVGLINATGSVDLTGSGLLEATGAPYLTDAIDLTGDGVLTAAGFHVGTGRAPADRTVLVPTEVRTLIVAAETRTVVIPAENRTVTA